MRIEINGVAAADKRPIKKALKDSFKPAPAVVITVPEATAPVNTTVLVVVSKGPRSADDQRVASSTIDAILMQNGYRFCNITFQGSRHDKK